MHTTGSRPKLVVSADGRGVVSHAGSRLLADLADATGLTGSFANALHRLRPRGTGHDPGRVAVDLAVMLADGGEAIADLALLRDQHEVFGPVASTPTAWRVLAPAPGEVVSSVPGRAEWHRSVATGCRHTERYVRTGLERGLALVWARPESGAGSQTFGVAQFLAKQHATCPGP